MLRQQLARALAFVALLVCGATGTQAPAQSAASGGTGYYYDPESNLVSNPAQISSNSISYSYSNGSPLQALIDGNSNTFFHSYWNRSVFSNSDLTEEAYEQTLAGLSSSTAQVNGTGWHNLQIELSYPVQAFYLSLQGRPEGAYSDFPTDIVVYATNDATLGNSTLASESPQWTQVTELTEGFPGAVNYAKYMSPVIEMDQEYKYLRLEVRNTTTSDAGGTGNSPAKHPELTGRTFAVGELRLYEAFPIDSWQARLDSLVGGINTGNYDITLGNDPGLYPADKVAAYNSALAAATNDGGQTGFSEEQCEELYKNLYAALNAVLQSERTPLTDGYYNIVSAYYGFNGDKTKAWKYDYDTQSLAWAAYDTTQPTQLFKIEKQADGGYAVQNIGSKKYLGHVSAAGEAVPFTDDMQAAQTFSQPYAEKPYLFKIFSPLYTAASNKYTAADTGNGANASGKVVAGDSDIDGESVWLLKPVEGQLLDSLLNASNSERINEEMRVAIDEARAQYDKCYDYESLFTDASQVKTNAQCSTEGSLADMLDGNTDTYFSSEWNFGGQELGWHNLQFTLPKAVSKIKFSYSGRHSTAGWVDDPDHITIYGTNDDARAESVAAADSLYWTTLVDMTKPAYDFPEKNLAGSSYTSPVLDLGGSYKYLRFVVKHTNGQGTMPTRQFANPSATGVTFEISEFRLYDGDGGSTSEANHIDGMGEAAETLDNLITTSHDKLVAGTATDADIAVLKTATSAVASLYIDRDSLDSALANALNEARQLYEDQTVAKKNVLTSVNQLSTNNVSYSEVGASDVEGAFENLIDNNLSTIFHSYWNRSIFSSSSVTEDQYLSAAASAQGVAVDGAGYHNLQVKFNEPLSRFVFTMTARDNYTYNDIPNDIEIYATNEDALGGSTLASESSQWDRITELNKNMPDKTPSAMWVSPTVSLGKDYKYVRFVVKNTNNVGSARPTTHPEITGVAWNLAEFHIYGPGDASSLAYSSNAELKEAVDALKPLVDEYSKIEEHTLYSDAPIKALQAAIDKVNAFGVHYNLVNAGVTDALYSNYLERADNSVSGKGIGYVDSNESIDAFRAALESSHSSAFDVPTQDNVNAAIKSMDDAYAEFLTHVGQITPNTWYNIISASTREVFIGQPIHVDPANHGSDLRVGDYDIFNNDPIADPFALWRFIPVEGTSNYYIQNLGTGQYVGDFVGELTTMQTQREPVAYRLIYYGDGGFKITQAANTDDGLAFKTDRANRVIYTNPNHADKQQVFLFEPAETGWEMHLGFLSNSIQIVTLPYDAKGDNSISALNAGTAKTYAVKSVTSGDNGTRLELKEIAETKAGEPFILVVGDASQPQGSDTVKLNLTVPETAVAEALEGNNGLVGTLEAITAPATGLGVLENSALKATTSGSTVIPALSGYINAANTVNESGDADLVISSTEGIINAIRQAAATAGKDGKVNIYTVDGVLVKKDADAAKAAEGLNKGVYIIGGKKVVVR